MLSTLCMLSIELRVMCVLFMLCMLCIACCAHVVLSYREVAQGAQIAQTG